MMHTHQLGHHAIKVFYVENLPKKTAGKVVQQGIFFSSDNKPVHKSWSKEQKSHKKLERLFWIIDYLSTENT